MSVIVSLTSGQSPCAPSCSICCGLVGPPSLPLSWVRRCFLSWGGSRGARSAILIPSDVPEWEPLASVSIWGLRWRTPACVHPGVELENPLPAFPLGSRRRTLARVRPGVLSEDPCLHPPGGHVRGPPALVRPGVALEDSRPHPPEGCVGGLPPASPRGHVGELPLRPAAPFSSPGAHSRRVRCGTRWLCFLEVRSVACSPLRIEA